MKVTIVNDNKKVSVFEDNKLITAGSSPQHQAFARNVAKVAISDIKEENVGKLTKFTFEA